MQTARPWRGLSCHPKLLNPAKSVGPNGVHPAIAMALAAFINQSLACCLRFEIRRPLFLHVGTALPSSVDALSCVPPGFHARSSVFY